MNIDASTLIYHKFIVFVTFLLQNLSFLCIARLYKGVFYSNEVKVTIRLMIHDSGMQAMNVHTIIGFLTYVRSYVYSLCNIFLATLPLSFLHSF